jgi:glycosyltransferase involved in cell wall biosynthesis
MTSIAVLIPHFENLEGLDRSLASIGNKEAVDVFLVDDGSITKPDTRELGRRHPGICNIFLFNFPENRGIEHALNEGLKRIIESDRYEYVARLDCGDICHPDRLSLQRKFLDQNPAVSLVGSWVEFADCFGNKLFTVRYPEEHRIQKKKMFLNNMFIHPSVMFRLTAVKDLGMYPVNFLYAEDYAYFFRFVKKSETANIQQVLISCEASSKRKKQVRNRLRIILENWEWNIYPVWGLFRNCMLYILPYNLIQSAKKLFLR